MKWLLVLAPLWFGGCAQPVVCRTPSSHACTTAQIDRYLAACVAPETALVIHCEQAIAAAPACTACLRASDGPLKESPGQVSPNASACSEHGCARCDGLRSVAVLFCS